MGMFDDPVTRAVVAQQEQKGGGNPIWGAIGRIGDVASRPMYGLGNLLEAIAYQASRPVNSSAEEQMVKGVVGETNPLKAVWAGLSGVEKTGPGTAVRKAYEDAPGPLRALLSNPVSEFGLNLATDPIAAGGTLGQGSKLSAALRGLGQGEDAGRAARIAGKIVTPERLQNLDVAVNAAGTNPALAVPGAALVGTARRFLPQADEAVERFFSGAVPKAVEQTPDDLMRQALEKVGASTPEGLMGHAVANSQAAQRGLEGIGGVDVPVSLSRPKPVVNPRVPPPDPGLGIGRALGEPADLPGQVPNVPALPAGPQMGGALPGPGPMKALPRGAIPGSAIAPEAAGLRQAALAKALGSSEQFSPQMRAAFASSTRRSPAGSFLSKAVVQDAQQLQEMLNNPDTRQQALRMLRDLVG